MLALGFRPFFLAAGAMATLFVPLWLLILFGKVALPTRLAPTAWHGHEMVFGFAIAVVAGFLLTAVRNWTSKPTASGATLAGLVLLWFLGRTAFLFEAWLPPGVAAAIDLAFLPILAFSIAMPIVRAKVWRNLGFVPLLLLLFATNLLFHLSPASQSRALRVSIDIVLLIVVLMGGRVIPSFTANATKLDVRKRPALDWLSFGSMASVAVLELLEVSPKVFAIAAIVAGVTNLARMFFWHSTATRKQPILWVLHVGYAWLGLGLLLRGIAVFVPSWPATAPLHLLSVGAIATLILGMMARVSLGHTGRMLAVRGSIAFAFVALTVAALVRGLGPLVAPSAYLWLLVVSGGAWSLAFAIFTAVYAPILTSPRIDGKPG
ncbi:MAG: NnrS family protein [Polyangiales bacterium]